MSKSEFMELASCIFNDMEYIEIGASGLRIGKLTRKWKALRV